MYNCIYVPVHGFSLLNKSESIRLKMLVSYILVKKRINTESKLKQINEMTGTDKIIGTVL